MEKTRSEMKPAAETGARPDREEKHDVSLHEPSENKETVRLTDPDRKSAVFLDLDGTLWNREQVPASAWQAIEKARKAGHLVFVNTGRTPDAIPDFLWQKHLDGYCLSTGMSLFDENGKQIASYVMDPEQAGLLTAWLLENHSGFALETDHMAYDDPKYAFRRAVFFEKEGRKDFMHRMRISDMPEEAWSHLVKIIFDSERAFDLGRAKSLGFDVLLYRNSFNAEGTNSGIFRGELTDLHRDKAKAMRDILHAQGRDPKEWRLVAAGDSSNDLPMLEAADVGVAMGNSSAAVKAAADLVTDSLEEDGLAHAFERLGLLEEQ